MDRSSRKRLRIVGYFIVALVLQATIRYLLNSYHVTLPENIVNAVKHWIEPELIYRNNKDICCSPQTLEAIKTIESELTSLSETDDEIEMVVKWTAYQTKLRKMQIYSESKSHYNLRKDPKSMTVSQWQKPERSRNPHMVIYAEKCTDILNKLVESHHLRFNITILGLNKVDNRKGYGNIVEFTRLLETFNHDDIVIYTNFENMRLLPTCSIDQIMGLYHDLKTPLVFMGIDASEEKSMNESYLYDLNAGASMGKIWAYLDLIHDAISKNEPFLSTNSQTFWKKQHLSNRKYIGVEYDRKLVPISLDEIDIYYTEIPKSYISVDLDQNLFMGKMEDVNIDANSLFSNNSLVINGRITTLGGKRPCIYLT